MRRFPESLTQFMGHLQNVFGKVATRREIHQVAHGRAARFVTNRRCTGPRSIQHDTQTCNVDSRYVTKAMGVSTPRIMQDPQAGQIETGSPFGNAMAKQIV